MGVQPKGTPAEKLQLSQLASTILHVVGIAASAGLLVACLFLPFLPGSHDPMAVIASLAAQCLGFAAVLLVPLGAAWLIVGVRARKRAAHEPRASGSHANFGFALATACVLALFVALACFGAFVSGSPTLGCAILVVSACGFAGAARRLRKLKQVRASSFHPLPLYLVVVPLAVLSARALFLEQAVASSRNRAIRNSAELIRDIEAFHSERGHYPLSLAAVHRDYEPRVIGIAHYDYEPRGAGYSVFFEQCAAPLGTREIVMYNKLDEHALPSHDSDILLWTSEQLAARAGHYAIRNADSPHWKYFWFD